MSQSPLHGPNQWPSQLPAFDTSLRRYIDSMLGVGAAVMRGALLGSLSDPSCPVLISIRPNPPVALGRHGVDASRTTI